MKIACFSKDIASLNRLLVKINKLKKKDDEIFLILFKYFYKDDIIESFKIAPVNKLILVTNINLINYDLEAFTSAISECYKKYKFDLIVFGESLEDKEVAARLSARLNIPALINCLDFKIEGNKLIANKIYQSGIAVLELETVLPAIVELYELEEGEIERNLQAQIEEIKIPIAVSRVIVRDKTKLSERYNELLKSNYIICIGENIHEEKELKGINDLANLIGARVIADKTGFARNWFKEWIGVSNLRISPKLCLSIGVKGDLDHIGGIINSSTIISLNEDPESPIFNFSDYYAVVDIHKLMEKLIKKLKKRIKR
jgi:electron transfer flavoprotein alpha subunit